MSCSTLYGSDTGPRLMGMHMGGWGLMRSMRRDEEMKRHKLTAGVVRRIAGFAKPYRVPLAIFLVLIIVDAIVGAVNPLIYRAIIDNGILGHNVNLVAVLAGGVAALAIFDAILGLIQRWLSARVGEGLIFDMRTKVFAHINEMPISFFTRTQTGALISRLNNDVLGAQQAFTDTFSSVVGNVIGVSITLVAMFFLSWQITLLSLILLPVFLLPARWVGRRLAGITRESYNLNAQMNTTMSERFNVSGALLVKLFGHPAEEVRGFASQGAPGPRHRHPAGDVRAHLHDLAAAHRLAGHRAGVRARRRAGGARRAHGGHGGRADRVSQPPLRPAHRALQRAGRHHDRAGQLRPGLRGARPAPDDRREA